MRGTVYGYQYAAADGPESAGEQSAILEFPVSEDNFYADRPESKNGRKEYDRLIGLLSPGDLLVVPALEQLGNTYEERLRQWKLITEEKKADIVVLDQPQLDTRPSAGALSGGSAAVLVLENLTRAERRRKMTAKKRQEEGIRDAKDRGVRFGRPRMQVPEEFPYLRDLWENHYISSRAAAKRLGITQQTFLRWVHDK